MATSPRLWNQKFQAKTLTYAPLAIIMGKTGAGKTTLCNMLCGTSHETGSAEESVTRSLYQNSINCGSYPFNVLDTPGTDSEVDTYKHAFLLRAALTGSAINTIFCVVKYDNRYRNTMVDFDELVIPVANYTDKIVVLISHSDVSKSPVEDFGKICAGLTNSHPKIANIIFYSERDSPAELANLMYCCVCNMESVTLSISDEEFHLTFKIYQMQYQIEASYKDFLKQKLKKEEEFTKFIDSLESDCQSVEDKDEILHMIMVIFKEEMETLSDEFIKKHGSSMQELDSYSFHIQMQQEIIKICNEFTQKVSNKMSYSLFDNTDPRNLIKRCPNCGEIWYKTEGCNGTTTCGNNAFSSYYDVRQKPFWRFTLERFSGAFRWAKIQGDSKQLPQKSRTTDDKRKGCGTSFEWGKLPPIEEGQIKELFKVKTIEEAKQLIREANYTKLRGQYASNIDVSRHT